MAQEMISQKIRRTCDGCGAVKEWEFVGITDNTIQEMENWRTVIREAFNGQSFVKLMVQACSSACLVAADAKIQFPKGSEEPSIDLASLRVGDTNIN